MKKHEALTNDAELI
jgi:hypothetical protein